MSKANGIEGEIWAYIGKRKSGKTTSMLEAVKDVPANCIYAREVHGSNWLERGATILPIKNLVDVMLTAVDCVFIVEDATPLFSGKLSEKFLEALVRSRDEGVTILLAFHSWRKTPFDIFDMINGVVIHKTRDLEYRITDRTDDEEILYAWKLVQESDNLHESITIEIQD
jgi:hypothetical protein